MFDPRWYHSIGARGFVLALALCCLTAGGLILSGCDSASTLDGADAAVTTATESARNMADSQKSRPPASPEVMARVNANLEALARATAQSLAEEATARFLHEQVLRRFDGDSNVLLMQLEERATALTSAPAGRAWSARVAEAAGRVSAPGVEVVDTSERVQAVVEEAEALYQAPMHLYWYEPENWDGQTAPWVALKAPGVDDVDVLPAFDAGGNRYLVEEKTAASRPVVVLTYNERVNDQGEVFIGTVGSGDVAKPIHCPPEGCLPGGGGGGGGGDGDGDGGNDYAGFIKLDWLKFYDDFEGWGSGDPEFRLVITRYNFNLQAVSQDRINYDRPLIESEYCDGRLIDTELDERRYPVEWNEDQFPTLHFQWYEADNDQLNFTIGLGTQFKNPITGLMHSIEFGVEVNNSDEVIGAATFVSDNVPSQANTGWPSMKVSLVPTES